MNEYINNFDKIKVIYMQLSVEKYQLIKSLMKEYWDKVSELLKIPKEGEKIPKSQIINYIKFFDPKKTPSSRLKIIESLPTSEKVIENNPQLKEELELMTDVGIFFPIVRSYKEYLLLTPEGLAFFFALLESKKYDNIYRLNTLILQNFEKIIYSEFRIFLFDKFKQLNIQKDKEVSLGFKDIAIILFFLINGSIGETKAFTRDIKGTEKALNCIVHSFDKNVELTGELRDDEEFVPIRILQSDLSLLQKKVGYPIYNEKSIYYIKENFADFLFKILKDTVKSKDKVDLKSRWEKLIKEYNYWRPLFRQSNICYFNYQTVEKLEKILVNS